MYGVVNSNELYHHGVLGMKWGVRRYQNYDGSLKAAGKEHTKEAKDRKGLTDGQKKAIKIGVAVAATALVAYGSYKLYKNGTFNEALNAAQKIGKSKVQKVLPKDAGGLTNPGHYTNNCKDVSEATLKRWLGVDASAVAGEKSFSGNLHDFVEARYNKSGIQWLGQEGSIAPDPSGNSVDRVSRAILKKCKDGDCGMVTVSWDPKKVMLRGSEDAHCFNWFVKDGRVQFFDDQPDPPLIDAAKHFGLVNPNVEIELCKVTKAAFAK